MINHRIGGNQPAPTKKKNIKKYRTRKLKDGSIKYEVRASYYNTVYYLGTCDSKIEAISIYDAFQINPFDYIYTLNKVNKEVLLFKDKKLINQFASLKECADYIKGDASNISKCCLGKYKTHKGYTFKYKEG